MAAEESWDDAVTGEKQNEIVNVGASSSDDFAARDPPVSTKSGLKLYTERHLLIASRGYLSPDDLQKFVKGGVSVNVKDKGPGSDKGKQPLHYLAKPWNCDVIPHILEMGAEINAQDVKGDTALHVACAEGHVDVVKILLRHNADMYLRSGYIDSTPAHQAAFHNQVKVIEALVQHDLDLNVTESNGSTVLHVAAQRGHCDLIRLLIKYGADVNAKNKYGEGPLDAAMRMRQKKAAKVLQENGAICNLENKDTTGPQFSWCCF